MISQTLFSSRKEWYPHMEIFTLELPAPYALAVLKTGHEWVLGVNISCRTAHSDLVNKNISIYADNVWFPFGNWTNYTVVQLYVQPNSLDVPLIGNVHIIVVHKFQFLFLSKLYLLSEVHKSYINLLCISGQSLSLWKFGYLIPL